MTTRKARVRRPVDGLVSLRWQATYACGCNSGVVKRKRDMPLQCAKHDDTVRTILHDVWMPNASGQPKLSETKKKAKTVWNMRNNKKEVRSEYRR